jgi:hypothetical protein
VPIEGKLVIAILRDNITSKKFPIYMVEQVLSVGVTRILSVHVWVVQTACSLTILALKPILVLSQRTIDITVGDNAKIN